MASNGGSEGREIATSSELTRAMSMKAQLDGIVQALQEKDLELKKQVAAGNGIGAGGSRAASGQKGKGQTPKKSRKELEGTTTNLQARLDAENEKVAMMTAEVQLLREENKRLQDAKVAADNRLAEATAENRPRLRERPTNGSPSSIKRKSAVQQKKSRKKLRTSPVTESDSDSDTEAVLESLNYESSLARLLKALELSEPWNDMYDKRPDFSLSFAYDALLDANGDEARKLVDDILAFQRTHRRAIWERRHWVRLPIAPKDPAMATLVRGWRSRYQAASRSWGEIRDRGDDIIDRHLPVGEKNPSLLEEGRLLTDELWLEPFVWGWPATTARLPAKCFQIDQIAALDEREPARVFFVNDITKDTYYKATNNFKYTTRHPLPEYPSE